MPQPYHWHRKLTTSVCMYFSSTSLYRWSWPCSISKLLVIKLFMLHFLQPKTCVLSTNTYQNYPSYLDVCTIQFDWTFMYIYAIFSDLFAKWLATYSISLFDSTWQNDHFDRCRAIIALNRHEPIQGLASNCVNNDWIIFFHHHSKRFKDSDSLRSVPRQDSRRRRSDGCCDFAWIFQGRK